MTDRKRDRSASTGVLTASADPVVAGEVIGHALFRMSPGDVPGLRKKPGPVPDGWARVPPSLLRYADEQTIAGTAAVFTAMAALGKPPDHFESWGVVAASRYLGRANLAVALRSFMAEGVWGTSPHLIPHFALHSASGSISLALGSHGPNVGVGGGLRAVAEGFLMALTWLSAGAVPGVWVVFTGWSPELVPDRAGTTQHAGECLGLALAIERIGHGAGAWGVRAVFEADAGPAVASLPDLTSLAELLMGSGEQFHHKTIAADASGHMRIELFDRSIVLE